VILMLRARLRDAQTDTVDWIATLQCTPQGNDNRQLAYDLGTLIGGAIGKRIDRGPL
jgi:lipoprotein signal peptidase